MSLMEEAECDIPETVIDRAHRHRIGKGYVEKKSKKLCKRIIVRFSTFRHRTKFFRSRSKLKNNAKVKLDLTKSRYMIFTKATETANKSNVMVVINCRLKVVEWSKQVFY